MSIRPPPPPFHYPPICPSSSTRSQADPQLDAGDAAVTEQVQPCLTCLTPSHAPPPRPPLTGPGPGCGWSPMAPARTPCLHTDACGQPVLDAKLHHAHPLLVVTLTPFGGGELTPAVQCPLWGMGQESAPCHSGSRLVPSGRGLWRPVCPQLEEGRRRPLTVGSGRGPLLPRSEGTTARHAPSWPPRTSLPGTRAPAALPLPEQPRLPIWPGASQCRSPAGSSARRGVGCSPRLPRSGVNQWLLSSGLAAWGFLEGQQTGTVSLAGISETPGRFPVSTGQDVTLGPLPESRLQPALRGPNERQPQPSGPLVCL